MSHSYVHLPTDRTFCQSPLSIIRKVPLFDGIHRSFILSYAFYVFFGFLHMRNYQILGNTFFFFFSQFAAHQSGLNRPCVLPFCWFHFAKTFNWFSFILYLLNMLYSCRCNMLLTVIWACVSVLGLYLSGPQKVKENKPFVCEFIFIIYFGKLLGIYKLQEANTDLHTYAGGMHSRLCLDFPLWENSGCCCLSNCTVCKFWKLDIPERLRAD